MAQILIVEDHENISKSLKNCIENEGHKAEVTDGIKKAKEWMTLKKPDLIILDWMLSDGQGIDLLTELRKQNNKTPVILLTARVDLVDKVLGLEMGANDYMTKPFESRELMARIRVQLRALQSSVGENSPVKEEILSMINIGPLVIDRLQYKISYNGVFVDLVKKEYDLLVLFAENPNKVFSRDEILNKVWGYDIYPTTRTVDTHVMLLRQKLPSDLIETVRSVGYRLKSF